MSSNFPLPTASHSPTMLHRSSSRRRFLQLAAGFTTGTALSSCGWRLGEVRPRRGPTTNRDELYVYTWSNYSDDKLTESFTAKTGIRVIVDTFDSNETMLAALQAGKGSNYSVIYPSDYAVTKMIKLGLLQPLEQSRLVGVENLKQRFRQSIHDPGNQFSIPVSWGTTGLIYNSEKITDVPVDWDYLWVNQAKLARRITLINDVREVMGAVLRSLGYSYNASNPKEIKQAYEKLTKLKPAIASFTSDAWRDQLLAGDLWVAMGYSADAVNVVQQNPKLKYVIPASGTSIWSDTMVIPKNAPNPDAAYEWINFLLEPSVAAQVTERLFFATPNQAAYDQLPPDLHDNSALFPADSLLAKSESIAPLTPTTTELYDKYWTQLTSS
jgi:spermidine/putrescine transport system substrate-binding protein